MTLAEATIILFNVDDDDAAAESNVADDVDGDAADDDDYADDDDGDEVEMRVGDLGRGHDHSLGSQCHTCTCLLLPHPLIGKLL